MADYHHLLVLRQLGSALDDRAERDGHGSFQRDYVTFPLFAHVHDNRSRRFLPGAMQITHRYLGWTAHDANSNPGFGSNPGSTGMAASKLTRVEK